ncbi:hypothetical protein JJC00_09655 [Bradyrhizobium diazoefficiens]|uniref:hypothetical protein n=1 Tax=Bradyrhizobium diazoefficiens TaxID=1355477 RepID=UPI00190D70AA|nr:hypothetical protein [Bradyrhizobium diazoefficiens]QQO35807.1 hypothetical protein JJC00_09655 [Bradyrhizobium diazoefficiens]
MLEQFKGTSLRHTSRWFDQSGLFGPVERRCYPWKWPHTTSSYASFMGTRSDIRMLTPTMREELLNDISKAVDRHGGEFEMDYETHLYMARRARLDK